MEKLFFTRDYLREHIEAGIAEIGEYTYGNIKLIYWPKYTNGRFKVGRYCSIAAHVEVMLGGNHRTDWVTTYPFTTLNRQWPTAAGIPGHPSTRGDVIVGSDVWIGRGATIMSGLTIGDGAVVAAKSIVTRDVPPYAIVAGNPAKVVRYRFQPEQIEALLRIRWWDWTPEEVAERVTMLVSGDVAAFVARYDVPVADQS